MTRAVAGCPDRDRADGCARATRRPARRAPDAPRRSEPGDQVRRPARTRRIPLRLPRPSRSHPLLPDAAVRLARRTAHARVARRSDAPARAGRVRRGDDPAAPACSRLESAGPRSAAAAILMALSPAMVFYSRMFIQEALFACFTLAFVIAVGRIATGGGRAWWILAGAGGGSRRCNQGDLGHRAARRDRWPARLPGGRSGSERPRNALTDGRWRAPAVTSLAVAAAVAAMFYSSFFTAPAGILEPFRGAGTYLARGIDPASHAHPWHYYLRLLAYTSSGGVDVERRSRDRARRRWRSGGVAPARWVESRGDVLDSLSRVRRRHRGGDLLADSLQDAVERAAVLRRGVRARRRRVRDARRDRRGHARCAACLQRPSTLASFQLGWQAWRAAVTYAADPRNPVRLRPDRPRRRTDGQHASGILRRFTQTERACRSR